MGIFAKSLGFRLTFFVVCILITAIGIFAYIFLRTYEIDLLNEAKRRTARLSDTIKRGTRYDMLEFRRENVHRTIETLGKQTGMERIRIYNKEGDIIFSTDKSEVGTKVNMEAEACFVCHSAKKPLEKIDVSSTSRVFRAPDGHRMLGAIDPIYNEKDCYTGECHAHPESQKVLGVLDIIISLQDIDQEIKHSKLQIIIFAIVSMFSMCLVIILFIYKYVTTPVRRLERGVQEIAKGNFDFEMNGLKSHDEIGNLARSFDKVRQELKASYEKLQGRIESADEELKKAYTELQEKQKQLLHAEKLASIGALAAGVAHEINNPLGTITLYAQMTLDDLGKDEQSCRENIAIITKHATRAAQIVRSLLEFARRTELEIKSININTVIDEVLSMTAHHAELQHVTVVKQLSSDLPPVLGDANKLQQVFVNMVINAFQAMSKEGGKLTLSTRLSPNGNSVEVDITDTGSGIPEDILDKIFDPFFTTKEKGTGLGLSVSHGIIEQHKGTISVKSKVGEGTTFTVTIPVAKEK